MAQQSQVDNKGALSCGPSWVQQAPGPAGPFGALAPETWSAQAGVWAQGESPNGPSFPVT